MQQALWMPEGSIRAVMSLVVLGAVIWFTYTKILEPAVFTGIAGVVVTSYFGARAAGNGKPNGTSNGNGNGNGGTT